MARTGRVTAVAVGPWLSRLGSDRRSANLLGQAEDDALGAAYVAEQVPILVPHRDAKRHGLAWGLPE